MSNFSDDVNGSVVDALVRAIKGWTPDPEGDAGPSETAYYFDGVETGVRMVMAYLNDEEIGE